MVYIRPNGGITKFAAVDFSGNSKMSLVNVQAFQPVYKGGHSLAPVLLRWVLTISTRTAECLWLLDHLAPPPPPSPPPPPPPPSLAAWHSRHHWSPW